MFVYRFGCNCCFIPEISVNCLLTTLLPFHTQCVEAFSMDGLDAIFTTDHLLSIQQLSCQYCMEYERKQDIIKCIISCRVSNLMRPLEIDSRGGSESSQTVKSSGSGSAPWISREDIGEVVSIWADDSEESMIEIEEGAVSPSSTSTVTNNYF